MPTRATTVDPTDSAGAARTIGAALPKYSPRIFAWFRWYGRRYMAKQFHGVWLARGGYRPGTDAIPDGPLVVVVNHPSWWDPMYGLVLSDRFGADRVHAAPIDVAALGQYGFFERIGFFGIEPGTARGAREFLRRSTAILADPRAMLWITGQGEFVDARERPLKLREGIGHLAARLGRGAVLPLALEYSFWEQSRPEAFGRLAPPILLGEAGGARRSPAEWTEQIRRSLEGAQDALAVDVRSRDASRFEPLLAGASGIGGVYDLWRRLKAAARGVRFDPRHSGADRDRAACPDRTPPGPLSDRPSDAEAPRC